MSAETLKQLKIKTSMVKRLKKEYLSYDKETRSLKEKIQQLEVEVPSEESQYEIKKQVMFNLSRINSLYNRKVYYPMLSKN